MLIPFITSLSLTFFCAFFLLSLSLPLSLPRSHFLSPPSRPLSLSQCLSLFLSLSFSLSLSLFLSLLGLVLPPPVAPLQVVIVPITKGIPTLSNSILNIVEHYIHLPYIYCHLLSFFSSFYHSTHPSTY